jgi:lysyl-tRNA synthetase class 2
MLEFYMAYADYQSVMTLTEELVTFVAQRALGKLQFQFQDHVIDFTPPWKRLRLDEGLLEVTGIDINAYPTSESLAKAMRVKDIPVDPNAPRGKLIESLLSDYLEPVCIQPTFLYDYPRDISPLAKSMPGASQVVERFEGFVAGFELCNAFTELNDPLDQEARFLEMGRDYKSDDEDRHPMDEDYLRALRYGMPPTGGFGMGIDRLVMLLTDSANIREVILFPHLREKE